MEDSLVELEKVYDNSKYFELFSREIMVNIDNLQDYLVKMSRKKPRPINPSYWEEKKVIVTGSAGMVGSTIVDYLVDMGADVYCTVRHHASQHLPNLTKALNSQNPPTLIEIDLKDYSKTLEMIRKIQPEIIFHEAAESFVPKSIDQPSYTVENNCVSSVNLLEAIRKEAKNIEGITLACSSEEYGFVKSIEEIPVKESNPLRPTSPYAATKVFTESIAQAYYYMYKLPVLILRTFNQEGPRRGEHFFTSRIAKQLANCLLGKSNRVIMGNPNSVRDFTHILDSALAKLYAVQFCERGEIYNICSGIGISTGDYAKLALRLNNLEDKCKLYVNKELLRPYERGEFFIDGFIGDNTKFVNKTGWYPQKTIKDIILDSVNFFKNLS